MHTKKKKKIVGEPTLRSFHDHKKKIVCVAWYELLINFDLVLGFGLGLGLGPGVGVTKKCYLGGLKLG